MLASEDVRYEQKHLLPLDMLEQLLGADRRLQPTRDVSETPRRVAGDEEAERELAELEQMAKRRYKATYTSPTTPRRS